MEVYLHDNRGALAGFDLKVPDHNTIWRTMTLLPEAYLRELNREVGRLLKRGEPDSCGCNGLQHQNLREVERP